MTALVTISAQQASISSQAVDGGHLTLPSYVALPRLDTRAAG